MSLVKVNTAFTWSGQQFHVGDVVDSSHVLYLTFPSRFTAADSGASSPYFKEGPFTIDYLDSGLAVAGVALFTTEAGDMLYGVTIDIPVGSTFDSGEKAFVGTAQMIADSDPIGATSPHALDVANYVAPGSEHSYYPAVAAFDAPNHWVTPSPTVVRFKIVTGGNSGGHVEVCVFGMHGVG